MQTRGGMVGVMMGTPPGLMSSLKRELLLVDQIGIVGLEAHRLDLDRDQVLWAPTPIDLDFLEQSGLITNIDLEFNAEVVRDREITEALGDARWETAEGQAALERMQDKTRNSTLEALNEWSRRAMTSRAHVCRALAIQLRRTASIDAVSLLPVPSADIDRPASRVEVLRLILDVLPMPDDSVPWEAIIDFRSDVESLRRLKALRVWSSELARGQYKLFEAREKLEHLLSEYVAALAKHRLGTTTGRLEIVTTLAADLSNDLASFGIASLVKTAVALRQDYVKTIGDTDIPGRDISYVVSAHARFAGGGA